MLGYVNIKGYVLHDITSVIWREIKGVTGRKCLRAQSAAKRFDILLCFFNVKDKQ